LIIHCGETRGCPTRPGQACDQAGCDRVVHPKQYDRHGSGSLLHGGGVRNLFGEHRLLNLGIRGVDLTKNRVPSRHQCDTSRLA
jgi:hypothetical protein